MPKRIAQYELGKTLGKGSYSKVKHGIDVTTRTSFAIKIIAKESLEKGSYEKHLRREIAVMKLLDHPNVMNLFDVLQTSKNIYMILEYLDGGDLLDALVAAQVFKEDRARRYFQQLVSGLSYLHSQGIAHRDLKPENLLLKTSDDTLIIADFGFSRLTDTHPSNPQLLKTKCGTPNYMAPEVFTSKGYNGKKSDIWSAGVVLYAMLAGYLPFEDKSMTVLCEIIQGGNYRVSSKFSKNARSMIATMLTVNPDERATLPDIIAHPFFSLGFDYERFDSVSDRLHPTAAQLEEAWQTCEEERSPTTKGASGRPSLVSARSPAPRSPAMRNTFLKTEAAAVAAAS